MYMRIVTGALHRDFSRDNYWTKVGLVSDASEKKTDIYLCASYEYLSEKLNTDNLSDAVVNDWVLTAVADIQKKGNDLFTEPAHIEVRAITDDGKANGITFLKEKFGLVTQ